MTTDIFQDDASRGESVQASGLPAHDKELARLKAENKRLYKAAKTYQSLCACYRVGKCPSEKLFAELKKARQYLQQMEGTHDN